MDEPQINRYTSDIKNPNPSPESVAKKVDPTAVPPVAKPAPTTSPGPTQTPPKTPPNPAARKKKILIIFGIVAALMFIGLIFAFVFVAQAGNGENSITRLLGIDQLTFINSLIVFIHVIFILVALGAFTFTMLGLFKVMKINKDDKIGKKAALKKSLIAGASLILLLIIWAFVYIYLDTQRGKIAPEELKPIVTEPEDTLNLSAPIEIKFDATNVPLDKEKYRIVSPNWDFGDGETGSGQIVSHTYTQKGIYDVTLEMVVEDRETNELSVGGEYHVNVSITNQALAAIIKVDEQSGEAPLKVNFDASDSVDPDGSIDRFEWDFDDDGEFDDADGKKVSHTFDKIGKYTVSLRVTSTTGEFDIEEKEIDVVKSEGPQAVITVAKEPEVYLLDTTYLFSGEDSTAEEGKIVKYEWDFGDGSKKVTTKDVSHSFDKVGTYQVTLTVTDENQKTGDTTKIITIGTPKGTPQAKITTEPSATGTTVSGKVPFKVSFDSSASTDSDNDIVKSSWDFDSDGEFDAFGSKANHTFTEEGTHTVTLEVADADDHTNRTTITVKVEAQGVNADLKANKIEGTVPLTVQFDASGSSYKDGQITSYRWDFGDDTATKLGDAQINHKYTTIGTYTATVTAIGADNASDTAEIIITVREIPLNACFVSVFEEGPAPLDTTFDPGCSSGTIANYLWDFGDGTTSTEVKPNHVFQSPGTYRVILEVSDPDNTVDQAELTINVTP